MLKRTSGDGAYYPHTNEQRKSSMNNLKITLIPAVDSTVDSFAKFTKGKRYPAVAFTNYSGDLLYKVTDDNGHEHAVNPKGSKCLGGHRFDIEPRRCLHQLLRRSAVQGHRRQRA
nr:unknown function [Klebsiella phage vB_Kpn_K2alpha62]